MIKPQGELLKCNNDKLQELSTVVQKAVQQSVKTDIQKYSQAVDKSAPRVTAKSLKTEIKEAAVEED